jgi:hypothetical protein
MTGLAREESHEPATIRIAYQFLALGFCSVVFWNGTKAVWGYSEVTTRKVTQYRVCHFQLLLLRNIPKKERSHHSVFKTRLEPFDVTSPSKPMTRISLSTH